MSPLHALLGFAAWTLLLVLLIFLYRGLRFLKGTPVNSWPRGGAPLAGDAAIAKRILDAHANCAENLPVFGAIVLAAGALGRMDAVQPLAAFVLYARVAQSLTHLVGTRQIHVLVRASFFFVQLALMLAMVARVALG